MKMISDLELIVGGEGSEDLFEDGILESEAIVAPILQASLQKFPTFLEQTNVLEPSLEESIGSLDNLL